MNLSVRQVGRIWRGVLGVRGQAGVTGAFVTQSCRGACAPSLPGSPARRALCLQDARVRTLLRCTLWHGLVPAKSCACAPCAVVPPPFLHLTLLRWGPLHEHMHSCTQTSLTRVTPLC